MDQIRPSARRRRVRFAVIAGAYLLQMIAIELHWPDAMRFALAAIILILLVVEFLHD